MRILVFSKFPHKRLAKKMERQGLTVVQHSPDVVLAWGGDGTFLLAEHLYPGIPKIIVRKKSICRKCSGLTMDEIIELLASKGTKGFAEQKILKLSATIKGESLPLAVNDVVVRNSRQMHALRFCVLAGRTPLAPGQIGDGAVVSTPFGSTGYYASITHESFEKGIGLALNNTVEAHPSYLLAEDAKVTIRIDRGEALVSIDTLERTWKLRTGDEIMVKRARERASLLIPAKA